MIGKGAVAALIGVVLFLLAGGYVLRPDLTRRNYDILRDMVESPAYDSLSANPNFANGMTQRAPAPGTAARGYPPLRFQATPEDAVRAGEVLSNPFGADDADAIARGKIVFANYCQVCHGPAGAGDGPVAKRGFPAPPSLLAEHAQGLKDGQMFHIVTFGQNNMPPHATQIMREDRWRAVLHVRQMQKSAPATAPAAQ